MMITAKLKKKKRKKENASVKWIQLFLTANFFFRGRLPLPSSSSSSYSCCCLSHRSCWEDNFLPSFLSSLLACLFYSNLLNLKFSMMHPYLWRKRWGNKKLISKSRTQAEDERREENLWFISFSRRNPGWELALLISWRLSWAKPDTETQNRPSSE